MEAASSPQESKRQGRTLHRHRRRTGIELSTFLRGRDDAPADFDIGQIERFYRGLACKAPREHVEYVIRLWSALPDRPARSKPPRTLEKVDFTPEIQAQLRGHWMRVGLSVDALFYDLTTSPPKLSARMVRPRLGDQSPHRTRKDHLEFMLAVWQRLPDGLGRLRTAERNTSLWIVG